MEGKAWGNAYRTTVVCVDSYDGQVLQGRLHNPFGPAESFHSTIDFLMRMEDLLDSMKFPQSFTAARSLLKPPAKPVAAASDSGPEEGKLATFAVRVLFRQNASWQGSVTWLETGVEESFRSVLELLMMMDGALRGK